MSEFDRRLPKRGLELLEAMPSPDWWKDLLACRFKDACGEEQPLFLALRDGYLNAYREGQSILKIDFDLRPETVRLRAKVHNKYVYDDDQSYLEFDGQEVKAKQYPSSKYEPGKSVDEWVKRARRYVGDEKKGVAVIVARNDNVIDVEMGLPANEAVGAEKRAPRMDIVALETDGKGIKIVFYEAKLFGNSELRAKNHKPQVLKQLQRYEEWFESDHRADEVVKAYRQACDILIRLNATRSEATRQPVHPLVVEAAKEGSDLRVDRKPRLIIFGYKPEQLEAYWEPHERALRDAGIDGGRLIMEPRPEDVALLDASNS